MEDMFLKKILLHRLITLKLRDRCSSNSHTNIQGFTLIELLVVIIIDILSFARDAIAQL